MKRYALLENGTVHTDFLELEEANELLERHVRIFDTIQWDVVPMTEVVVLEKHKGMNRPYAIDILEMVERKTLDSVSSLFKKAYNYLMELKSTANDIELMNRLYSAKHKWIGVQEVQAPVRERVNN